MSDVWLTIGVLTVATAAIKAAGPLAVGGRELPPAAIRVISLLAPTILAALVVVQTFSDPDGQLVLDARAIGLAAGAGAIALKASMLVVVVAAAATAAGARAVGVA